MTALLTSYAPNETAKTVAAPRPRIAIVSHFGYGALSGSAGGRLVGGVEWQTSLTARWLAARGYSVSMLTWDEGQRDDEDINGVRVIKLSRRDAGVPVLRFFHPRWTGLVGALRRADADVYYQNCGEYVTGQVAHWCRRNRRGFVYSVASDPDCDRRLPAMKALRERVLYRYGVCRADEVIVQTRRQQQMLQEGFGRESTVIPMPCVGPGDDEYRSHALPAAGCARVAWVGRVVPLKRLEWLLDVAEALPSVAFDVVGPPDPETDYTRALFERGSRLANVTLHGRVDRSRMPALYQAAACLCCTSTYEGFPNTFLEAWSQGTPIVTTVNPDGLVAERGLGLVASNVAGIEAALRRLVGAPDFWKSCSASARRHFARNHAVDVVMPRFEAVFVETARRTLAARRGGEKERLSVKVALVTSFPRDPGSPRGGVEAVSVILASSLAQLDDVDVHAVTTHADCPQPEMSNWENVTIHRLPRGGGSTLTNAVRDGRRIVSDYVSSLRPDVIHAHDTYGLMVKGLPTPRVFTIHGFIYGDTLVSGERFAWVRSQIWRRVETAGWAEQPHIISISPYVRERLFGIATGTIHDIDNPIAASFFELPRREQGLRIFSAALICPRKNTLGLVEAFSRVRAAGVDAELRLAGPVSHPAYGQQLQGLIESRGLQKSVTLLGRIGTQQIHDELASASVFGLVSLEENSPMGIEEAMAAGVPVVTSNRCGMPYMVRDGETGFLVDPLDPADIAWRLGEVLADPALRTALGARARQVAQERFHPARARAADL